MCLGPNFVKLHLPQLLLLWKTALPKVPTKEGYTNRSEIEWAFMFHVRECVLGAISCFLLHNGRLVTPDVAKRLAALLSNTLSFITLVPPAFLSAMPLARPPILPPSLSLSDRIEMLQRRILQCFLAIKPIAAYDNLSLQLLKMCLSNFADPDKSTGSSITAAITREGSFGGVWSVGDGYGYGVTSKLKGMDVGVGVDGGFMEDKRSRRKDWLNRDMVESEVENLVSGIFWRVVLLNIISR